MHKRVKILALSTESHRPLLDNWLLPTLEYAEPDCIKEIRMIEQTCKSGCFLEPGWIETTTQKINLIMEGIRKADSDFIIWCDCDIQIFRPFIAEAIRHLGSSDIFFQRDDPNGTACTGFMIIRVSEATFHFWRLVSNMMKNHPGVSDQKACNTILKGGAANISYGLLPTEFYGAGTLVGRKSYRWHPGDKMPVPVNVLMHHANWTIGVSNKIEQLQYVRMIFQSHIAHGAR